ncbi:hypothetical protein [Methylobacter sp. YRD-M1]|uniref:hypothetical protein n=1 Tax=Methylobacter sp. YRD-M1 TaxID=2911520 RepID=UPI00227BAB3C|nr:hypothetical protein [Methylobacter sp. YRD-M1]WAK03256.1 hypothetical protein LZ558_05585 [Methylobacter sp. YRD-M1]
MDYVNNTKIEIIVMKNKLMKVLAAGVLLTATGLASAEPVALTDAQMDNVSAGGLLCLDLDSLVGSSLTLVGGVLGSVVGTVDALLPNVDLQLGASATVGAGFSLSL